MDQTVILDACCTLNFSATGHAAGLLRELPYRFVVGSRARGEAQWLATPGSEDREPVELQTLLDLGLLIEECLENEVEEEFFVEFSVMLADGEAEAAALAAHRGYLLATDDRKARRIVSERHPGVALTGTLELLREWQQITATSDADMADLLRRISERATYRPRRSHPLWPWWAGLLGES